MDGVEDAEAWLRFYLDDAGYASPELTAGVVRCLGGLGIEAAPRPRAGDRSVEVRISNRADVLWLLDAAMLTVPRKREAAEALVRRLRDPNRREAPAAGAPWRAYWDEGLGVRAMAARFGYGESGICRLMKKRGVPVRPRDGTRGSD